MNWDDTRVFLALCREHTLRGAARALHIDQATVGRRLASLEAALGSTLFLRTSSGYLLTPAGEAAFELAEKMECSALELLRRTRGMDHRLSGEVRLSTTDSWPSTSCYPPWPACTLNTRISACCSTALRPWSTCPNARPTSRFAPCGRKIPI